MRPEPDITPGSTLPARLPKGFEIEEHVVDGWLRDGGMAAIYRAHRASDGQRVAVKLQLPSTAHDPVIGERFEREAELMWRIRGSAHVVELFDVGMLDDGRRYLVMEWVDGEDLGDLLDFLRNQDQRLSIPRACRIGRDVARGLAALHERGVAHLDLKPANVMIGWGADGSDVVELVDFGIAADLWAQEEPGTVADGGRLMGTSRYVSPQQARGQRPSPSFDVYALGVLLFESLTGSCVPPDGWSPQTLPRVNELRRGVPTALAELVRACMDPDPARRPASAMAVAEALERILAAWSAQELAVRTGGTEITPRSGEVEVLEVPEPPEIPEKWPGWDEAAEARPVRTGETEVALRYEEVLASPEPAPVMSRAEMASHEAAPAFVPVEVASPAMELPRAEHVEPELVWNGRWPWLRWAVAAGMVVVLGGAVAWLSRGEEDAADEAPAVAAMGASPSPLGHREPEPKPEPSPEPEPQPAEEREPPVLATADVGSAAVTPTDVIVEPEPSPVPPVVSPPKQAREPSPRAAGPSAAVCEERRAAASDAKKARAWSAVLQATAERRCWATAQQRLERRRLRVEAYAERGELSSCVKEAGPSRDREVVDRVGFCKKILAGRGT